MQLARYRSQLTTVCIDSKRAFELDPDFIGRFSDLPFPVKREASCGFDSTHQMVDLEDGRPGIKFLIGDLQYINKDSATIWFGSLQGDLGGSGATFGMKKSQGRWEVKSTRLELISSINQPFGIITESNPLAKDRNLVAGSLGVIRGRLRAFAPAL